MKNIEQLLGLEKPLPEIFAKHVGSKIVGEGNLKYTRSDNAYYPYGFYDVRLLCQSTGQLSNLNKFIQTSVRQSRGKLLFQMYKVDEYEVIENSLHLKKDENFKFLTKRVSVEKDAADKGELLRNIS